MVCTVSQYKEDDMTESLVTTLVDYGLDPRFKLGVVCEDLNRPKEKIIIARVGFICATLPAELADRQEVAGFDERYDICLLHQEGGSQKIGIYGLADGWELLALKDEAGFIFEGPTGRILLGQSEYFLGKVRTLALEKDSARARLH